MKKKSFLKFWTTTQLSKLYCILFLCFFAGLNAQTRSIKGKITDDTSTVPGVTIKVNNKPTTAFSDENGNYTILAAENDVLVFSYLGYKTIQIVVANQATINVKLTEDATTLKEIVINAGYYSIKEKEQTGSIARMTAKDIDKQPVTNVLAAMQGRMAGVNIIQDGGTPGGGFQIKIRGRNSIRLDGNEPLYIIDGVPYSNESIGSANTSTALPSQPAQQY